MFMKKILNFALIVFSLAVLFSSSAFAARTPSAVVSETIAELQTEVKNYPENADQALLDKEMQEIVKPAFDFMETAKRSLGAHWNDISVAEQSEFSTLFSDLLTKTYINRIKDGVKTSEIKVTDAKDNGKNAAVRTLVESKDETATIIYKMHNKNGNWLVYDVVIENIGLVNNYRDEFSGIIRKDGFAGLMTKLRNK
jgi:phospholipid transport system substrate-binding protein